jgi:hypothetical protein
MFFNKYFFAKVGRRKHTGKFLMLQFYKSLLQFYKKQENRPYTRLYGRFSYLRLSIYSSQSFRSEHGLRSRFAHSYITIISHIHNRCDSACLLYRAPFRISVKCKNQRRYSCFCGRDVGQIVLPFASLSTKSAGLMELAQPVLDWRHAHTTATEHFQQLLST